MDVTIYDAVGRRIRTLHKGWSRDSGVTLKWDGRDDRGEEVAPGVYLARVRSDGIDRAVKILRD